MLKQTLRGYKIVNRITDAEDRAWAARLTPEEARKAFEDLYRLWERTAALSEGDWDTLDRFKIAELIQEQQPFVRLARRKGQQ